MFQDFLYVIGGSEDNHRAVSERFSFSKKTWQYISFHDELGLYGCAVTVFHNCIYSIGGSWAEGGADYGVYCFDPRKNEWTKQAATLHSHTQACAFVVNNQLYVEVYDEDNGQWHDVPQPHIPPNSYGAVEIQGDIYFILGNFAFNSGIKIADDEAYHVDIEDWQAICHHDAEAVFVSLPVDNMEAHQTSTESAILNVLSEETDHSWTVQV